MARSKRILWFAYGLAVLAGLSLRPAFGLGDKQFVSTASTSGSAVIAADGKVAAVMVDADDWPGVGLAVGSFAGDLKAVSGVAPQVLHDLPRWGGGMVDLILVGTIGRSTLIDRLVKEGKLGVSGVRGQWEASVTQRRCPAWRPFR